MAVSDAHGNTPVNLFVEMLRVWSFVSGERPGTTPSKPLSTS
jgi:hypothetical protein